MRDTDRKKLWARSGNVCSFPGCPNVLAQPGAPGILGQEAHIKGDKPGSPRYDIRQTPEERDSYANRILLCPNHHTEIDRVNAEKYSVEDLLKMKSDHEAQVDRNWNYPALMEDLRRVVRRYAPDEETEELQPKDIIEQRDSKLIVRVDASSEGGLNTLIKVKPGQKLSFFATGLISYDGGYHFTTPEGIICNDLGLPLALREYFGHDGPATWSHPDAYKTDADQYGIIGCLFGYIGEYTPDRAFKIGSKREYEVTSEGELYLAVNDAKGTYGDNFGDFRVDIKIDEIQPVPDNKGPND